MTDVTVWTAWSLGRHTCPDVSYRCPQQHHRRLRREPSQWSLHLPDQHTRTTQQMWRARQRRTTQQATSQQGISGKKWTSRRLCTTQQLLPTQHRIRTQQVLTQHAHRTQLATTRHIHRIQQVMTQHTHRTQHVMTRQGVTGQQPRVPWQGLRQLLDKTLSWFLMSAVSCSPLPRIINQATSLDFISMWTLMQRRMDRGMAPDAQSRPVDQTPMTTLDHSPPRRSETPDRRSRTPDRRPRTPVRRARGMDESRDSTRSRSAIRRSSSSESCTRDTSPVNFSAALNTEDKVKGRSISDEEDDEGSQKKVSATQYQLFRQAVKSSKGTCKVNPSKSRRAPRVSLMDLGETEASDRVSRLDQPSLVDTMASTGRIAQGLKEDEDVEKTTLSETLNTSSSTFEHLTVKQIFPREPYRLKVHRERNIYPSLQRRLVSVTAMLQLLTRFRSVCVWTQRS